MFFFLKELVFSLLLATHLSIPVLYPSFLCLLIPFLMVHTSSLFLYTYSVQFLTTNWQLPSLSLSPSISQKRESDLPNSIQVVVPLG